MLHDSINKLGEAIKKDEEYAQETRRQLDDIRSRLKRNNDTEKRH
ncbi:TraP [Escherichia coli]|nr:TraP [Escherichia coli]